MARTLGLGAFTVTIEATNTPQKLKSDNFWTDAFRVYAPSGNAHAIALGDASVTLAAGASTDGEPIAAGAAMEISIDVKSSSTVSELDLSTVWVVGTSGDKVTITYIKKAD